MSFYLVSKKKSSCSFCCYLHWDSCNIWISKCDDGPSIVHSHTAVLNHSHWLELRSSRRTDLYFYAYQLEKWLLLWPVIAKHGSPSKQQDPWFDIFAIKPAPSQDWQLLVDLFLVKIKNFNKGRWNFYRTIRFYGRNFLKLSKVNTVNQSKGRNLSVEMLSLRENLGRGCIGIFEASNHTIELKEGSSFIHRHPYRTKNQP